MCIYALRTVAQIRHASHCVCVFVRVSVQILSVFSCFICLRDFDTRASISHATHTLTQFETKLAACARASGSTDRSKITRSRRGHTHQHTHTHIHISTSRILYKIYIKSPTIRNRAKRCSRCWRGQLQSRAGICIWQYVRELVCVCVCVCLHKNQKVTASDRARQVHAEFLM